MTRSVLASARAVGLGAMRALRDPRLLARLATPSAGDRERRYEDEATRLLGGAPRTVPIEALLAPDSQVVDQLSFLDDASTVLDLLLLKSLVARSAGRRYLEVGTFRGESAVAVATEASKVVTLSLSEAELVKRGGDQSWIAAHRTFSEGDPRIQHVSTDSRQFDIAKYRGWADVVFIDGDHSREAVEADTATFWPVRERVSGVMVWHDAFSSALEPRWEVLAGISAGLPRDALSGLVHVSNTLCVAWLPGAASLSSLERSYVPRIAFEVRVRVLPDWMSARQRAGHDERR